MSCHKVLLIVDNYSAASGEHEALFPAAKNTTSKMQPCDLGIIQSLKAYYRRRFKEQLLDRPEEPARVYDKFELQHAIRMAVVAWMIDVNASTINNCFQRSKIRGHPDSDTAEGSSQFTAHQSLLGWYGIWSIKSGASKSVSGVFTDDDIIATVLGGHGGDPEDADDCYELAEIKEFENHRTNALKKCPRTCSNFVLVKEGLSQGVYDWVTRCGADHFSLFALPKKTGTNAK